MRSLGVKTELEEWSCLKSGSLARVEVGRARERRRERGRRGFILNVNGRLALLEKHAGRSS